MVDQIWSISPVIYMWYFAVATGFHPKVVLLALLVSVWGVRLTYNFARKGGYSGEEDYRWPVSDFSLKHLDMSQSCNPPPAWHLVARSELSTT